MCTDSDVCNRLTVKFEMRSHSFIAARTKLERWGQVALVPFG